MPAAIQAPAVCLSVSQDYESLYRCFRTSDYVCGYGCVCVYMSVCVYLRVRALRMGVYMFVCVCVCVCESQQAVSNGGIMTKEVSGQSSQLIGSL